MKRRNLAILVLVLIAFCALATAKIRACGYAGISTWLQNGEERERILYLPTVEFRGELSSITGAERLTFESSRKPQRDRTLGADVADLKKALADSGLSETEAASTVSAYQSWREEMTPKPVWSPEPGDSTPEPPAPASPVQPRDARRLSSLPAEFALYGEGAALWHVQQFEEAESRWKSILGLPADERRHKSVWASYMLGVAAMKRSLDDAYPWFEQARQLAAAGFPDSAGLATEALGWMARAEWKRGDLLKSLHSYLDVYRTGSYDQQQSAGLSIRQILTNPVFEAGETDPALLADPVARQVVAAMILARPRTDRQTARLWMEAISKQEDAVPDRQAERLAWSFYRYGDIDASKRCLGTVDELSDDGKWVRAKIHLREGRIDDALELMREITSNSDTGARLQETLNPWKLGYLGDMSFTDPKAQGEIATLLVGRKEYIEAMDLFFRHSSWLDGIYIAERILTIRELEEYIERLNAKPLPEDRMEELRYLLFRRYVRTDQLAKADKYCPEKYRELFDRYCTALDGARYGLGPLPQSARSWFETAVITRTWGMELMGTEIGPDWSCDLGWFDHPGAPAYRLSRASPSVDMDPLTAALSATVDEKRRYAASAPEPDRRYHYRWIASDYAWSAARLLPDNDPLLAQSLYWGGTWIKYQDVEGADRFYQDLVSRCWKLPIGPEADRIRWFPQTPPPEVVPVPMPNDR